MLEWFVCVGIGLFFFFLAFREKGRPVRRQIHCDVEVIELPDRIEVFVDNRYGVEVTASFEWSKMRHIQVEEPLPRELVIAGGERRQVACLWPTHSAHTYSLDWSWVWGSVQAEPDLDHVYHLPYASGSSFLVSQGPGGEQSHQGDCLNAVDFAMPVGTPVLCARPGLVVDLEDVFAYAGWSREQGGNYVLVRHEDGTVGEYYHLKTGGVRVEVGQRVEVGELLAYSGNTGRSSGPHLHFMVFRARNGKRRESVPLRFWVAGSEEPVSLSQGYVYAAP